jgi:hypothetical protein
MRQSFSQVWRWLSVLGHVKSHWKRRNPKIKPISLQLLEFVDWKRHVLWNWHHSNRSKKQNGVILRSLRYKVRWKNDFEKANQRKSVFKRHAILCTRFRFSHVIMLIRARKPRPYSVTRRVHINIVDYKEPVVNKLGSRRFRIHLKGASQRLLHWKVTFYYWHNIGILQSE